MSGTTLRALGFCGVDDSIEPELLAAVSSRYEFIEWGILFREELNGTARFASKQWLQRLSRVNNGRQMRLAGHLCSSRCEEVLKGDSSFVRSAHEELGIGRFQINATAANHVDMALVNPESAARLRAVMEEVPQVEFIIQRNAETRPLWGALEASGHGLPPNMSYLFDESKGTGVVAAEWPEPPRRQDGGGSGSGGLFVPFGYAGGLGPATLEAQLIKMANKTDKAAHAAAGDSGGGDISGGDRGEIRMWVDMESSLRTALADGTDVFDLNKAMRCILIAESLVQRGVLAAVGGNATHPLPSPPKKPRA